MQQGTQIELIQRMLNHAPKGVTGKHYEFSKMLRPLRRAFEQWENTLMAVGDGTISRYEQIGEWAERRQPVSDEQLVRPDRPNCARGASIRLLMSIAIRFCKFQALAKQ